MRLEEKAGARSSRGFERCVKKFEYLSQARGISSQVINAGEEGVILQKDHTGCRTETRPVMITEHLIGSESQSWFLRLHFLFLLPCTGEGNGNPLQCSCLENPRDGGASSLPSMGSHRVGYEATQQQCVYSNPKLLIYPSLPPSPASSLGSHKFVF